jgi:hypothetical protein
MMEWLLIAIAVLVGVILYLNRSREWAKGVGTALFWLFILWGCAQAHRAETNGFIDFFKNLGGRIERAYYAFLE